MKGGGRLVGGRKAVRIEKEEEYIRGTGERESRKVNKHRKMN